jgi:hypothetical protein
MKLKFTFKDVIPGTLIWLLITSILFIIEFLPIRLIPTALVSVNNIINFFIVSPFLVSTWYFGYIILASYLFVFFNFLVLVLKKKNKTWMNITFFVSSVCTFLLWIIGLIMIVAHP